MSDQFDPAPRARCGYCRGSGDGYWHGNGYDACEGCAGTGFADRVDELPHLASELSRVKALARSEIARRDEQIRVLTETLHSLPR